MSGVWSLGHSGGGVGVCWTRAAVEETHFAFRPAGVDGEFGESEGDTNEGYERDATVVNAAQQTDQRGPAHDTSNDKGL